MHSHLKWQGYDVGGWDYLYQGCPLSDKLLRRGLRLEYITLSWNIIGVVVVFTAAIVAHSVALTGFGIDSLIEIFASVVVVWQLKGTGQDREHRAMRLISIAFVALVIYVVIQSGRTLLMQAHPDSSTPGIIWLAATLVAMLLLSWGKHQTGERLNNPVLLTEARVTLVDAYLAAAVLIGLVVNSLLGWWWADPLAGLVIVYYGLREALHAWHESKE